MDAQSIRFLQTVRTQRCDSECSGHLLCLIVSTAFLNTAKGGVAVSSSLLWQCPTNMFFIWNFIWRGKEATFKSIIQQFKTGCNFFLIYKRSLPKHSCGDHSGGWGVRYKGKTLLTPAPLPQWAPIFTTSVPLHPHSVLSFCAEPLHSTCHLGGWQGFRSSLPGKEGRQRPSVDFFLHLKMWWTEMLVHSACQRSTGTSGLVVGFMTHLSGVYMNVLCYSLYVFICLKYFLFLSEV